MSFKVTTDIQYASLQFVVGIASPATCRIVSIAVGARHRSPPGIHPGSHYGTFVFRPLICTPLEKILLAPIAGDMGKGVFRG